MSNPVNETPAKVGDIIEVIGNGGAYDQDVRLTNVKKTYHMLVTEVTEYENLNGRTSIDGVWTETSPIRYRTGKAILAKPEHYRIVKAAQ